MSRNRQPELFAAALIPYTAALVALVLRMIARKRTKMPYVWEDYLAAVAFVIGSAFTFLSLAKVRWGLGKHMSDIQHLSKDDITHHYFLDLWADMWLYTFSVGLSKFVILGFYWRMFQFSVIRQPIRILIICSVGWIVARVFLILFQCQPIRKFWQPSVPGQCALTPMLTLFGAGIPHFVLEVAILLCPLIEIWRLHLPTAKKFAVAAMFMSGLLTCGSALGTIVHTIELSKNAGTGDLTWNGLDDQIWAVCDVNLASFATSLPLLRPVLRSFISVFNSRLATTPSNLHGVYPPGTTTTGPHTASKRTRTHRDETDSVIELAGDGGHVSRAASTDTQKAYVMQDVGSRDSDEEVWAGTYMQRQTGVGSTNNSRYL